MAKGQLDVLNRRQCLDRLAQVRVGRIVFTLLVSVPASRWGWTANGPR